MNQEQFLSNVARYHDIIRTGGVAFDYRTGRCGPVPYTVAKTWGAACPPGWCPPENLPQALGRYFAGDRAGCREVPFTVELTATRQAAAETPVTVTAVSPITMCPTRMILTSQGTAAPDGQWILTELRFANQNQIAGDPIHFSAFAPGAFQPVPFVPDCLRAGMPYTISATLAPDAGVGDHTLSVTFIGPASF